MWLYENLMCKTLKLTQYTLLYSESHKEQSQASAFSPDSPTLTTPPIQGQDSHEKRNALTTYRNRPSLIPLTFSEAVCKR